MILYCSPYRLIVLALYCSAWLAYMLLFGLFIVVESLLFHDLLCDYLRLLLSSIKSILVSPVLSK